MKKFLVRTDNLNLTFQKISENTTLNPSRLARITDILNSFEFKIEHVRGVDNPVADLLSRGIINTLKELTEETEKSTFAEAQEQDKEICGIRKILQKEILDANVYSRKERDRLMRISRRYCLNERKVVCYKKFYRGRQMKLIVIPSAMQAKLIKEVHDGKVTGCHMGVTRTYNKLANLFYFPNLYTKLKEYVKTCKTCQLKTRRQNTGK